MILSDALIITCTASLNAASDDVTN